MYELRKIQGLFNLMGTNAKQNAKDTVEVLQDNACEKRNKWYMRSAKLLSLHSKINVQKSYWRMRENVWLSGQRRREERAHHLRKVAGIVGKYEKYALLRAFYSIMRVGKRGAEKMDISTIVRQKYESQPGMPDITVHTSPNKSDPEQKQSYTLQLDNLHRGDVESSIEVPTSSGQLTGVRMAERIFKRSLGRHLSTWQDNSQPERKLQRVHEEAQQVAPALITDISKYGALESMAKVVSLEEQKATASAFRTLAVHSVAQSR